MANLIITKPLLALRGVLIFPGMIANLDVGREKSIAAIDAAEGTDKQIILVGQKQPEQENVAADDLYEWGKIWKIETGTNSLKFYAIENPKVNLNILVKAVF